METKLGRIKSVKFGHVGYHDSQLGISFDLGGDGWGVGDSKAAWDANLIKHSEHCKWTEETRSQNYDEIMRYVSDLLAMAKVDTVEQLKGIPVECKFDGMELKDWRILEEVL